MESMQTLESHKNGVLYGLVSFYLSFLAKGPGIITPIFRDHREDEI